MPSTVTAVPTLVLIRLAAAGLLKAVACVRHKSQLQSLKCAHNCASICGASKSRQTCFKFGERGKHVKERQRGATESGAHGVCADIKHGAHLRHFIINSEWSQIDALILHAIVACDQHSCAQPRSRGLIGRTPCHPVPCQWQSLHCKQTAQFLMVRCGHAVRHI